MPVCHLTLHAHGTWWPDHQKGYTTEGDGVLPPDFRRANQYRAQSKFDAVTFDESIQRVLIAGGYDVLQRRSFRSHVIGTDPTHAHYLFSHAEYFNFDELQNKVKNLLSLFIGRLTGLTGFPWFVEGSSHKRVKNREHFDYLVSSYISSHRGLFWKEGDALPTVPAGLLDRK